MKLWLVALLLASACTAAPADLGPWASYPLPQEAKTVAVGDLNGDGRDDVAATAWPSGLYVLYQQPDGTLAQPVSLWSPNMPLGLAIGDLNADRRPDLAVGGTDEFLLIYYQQPDGTLASPVAAPACGFVTSLAIADLSGDGLADLAQVGAYCPGVLVSPQGADGGLGFPAFYPFEGSNARCVCVSDFDCDGVRDLAFLVDDRVCLMSGAEGGGFGPPRYLPAPWAHALASGDVTGDGADDLVFTVATNAPDAAVGVYPGGDDGPGPLRLYPALDFAQALVLLDVDRDGRRDVAVAHGGYEALTVMRQIEGGALGAWTAYTLPYCNGYEPGGLACGDLNSDGFTDVAVADWWNGLVVLAQTGNGSGSVPDTDPPVLTLSPLISTIWPPNGEVVNVPVSLSAVDEGSGVASLVLTVEDEYGLVEPETTVTDDTVVVPLVAFRNDGDPDGRVYTLILTGTDSAGNVASVAATVGVPKSNPKSTKPDKPRK